jgi:hypothetical protein
VESADLLDGPTDDLVVDATNPPTPAMAVRLRGIRTFHIVDDEDEDETVLVVSDGEAAVEFVCGISGVSGSAARGARRLANALSEFASVLEARVARANRR